MVSVNLAQRTYDIHVKPGLLDSLGELLAPFLTRPRVVIVTDSVIADLHLDRLTCPLEQAHIHWDPVVLDPGEKTKSWDALQKVTETLIKLEVERNDLVIAFGGGVIGDLAGFAAAIVRRGVNYVQIPTTLLAQVDSSVGGKTGINSFRGKNLIGSFYQPKMVLVDLELLTTLPARVFWAGYGEVLKYGLLGDVKFFDWMSAHSTEIRNRDLHALNRVVTRSCEIKASLVSQDEQERGQRALLNLGHTFGHAFETLTGYSDRLLHGEAVTIGCKLAFELSYLRQLCPRKDVSRVVDHMKEMGLVHSARQIRGKLPTAEAIIDAMHQDKKAVDGKVKFVLVEGIGKAFVADDVDLGLVQQVLQAHL